MFEEWYRKIFGHIFGEWWQYKEFFTVHWKVAAGFILFTTIYIFYQWISASAGKEK